MQKKEAEEEEPPADWAEAEEEEPPADWFGPPPAGPTRGPPPAAPTRGAAAAKQSWNLQLEIIEIYRQHNSKQLERIDEIFLKYPFQLSRLLAALREKYVDPTNLGD